ncbi:MAG: DUF3015 family protein [Bdellovibrionaceae bacterium]|nr:DUF3015 family protein [Pseudobdellovibrionaceae bacterium]
MTKYILFFLSTLLVNVGFARVKNDGLKGQLQGPGGYGYAGCGFGSMMFAPKENQLIAITSNHITSSQAFGISSGTSNCYPSIPVPTNSAGNLPNFIEMNKDRLSVEASRGHGETINSLSVIMDCKPKEVGTTLKENYKKIFVDTKMESASIEASLHNLIDDNQSCF